MHAALPPADSIVTHTHSDRATVRSTLITAVARCWRVARDERENAQKCLYALLRPVGLGVLAPVFDSLFSLCESALGRPIATGLRGPASADEQLVLGMLDGSRPRRDCLNCDAGKASALDCAICSTRIMLTLAVDDQRRMAIG
ncbi:hypothetical protein [Sphingomonas sp. Leaf10]|uniref:hypothetical protein n=1 Tax=Sphingomonas sp. Leaf10 TaxID=1735676 RepID=UPI000A621AFE|nr:hypothetical protein [Sphingomonas sp. Leaf10]